MAERLALAKADDVAKHLSDGPAPEATTLVLGADTVVADGDVDLGKPNDDADAAAMLRRLRGRAHVVSTGVALVDLVTGVQSLGSESTVVHLREMRDEEIAQYVATGDPRDKAGGYAIQNQTFHPVARIDGCFSNVVGLPLCLVTRLLRERGVAVVMDWIGEGPTCQCAGLSPLSPAPFPPAAVERDGR
jgi:MAF protein